jgi:hypothetical protein
MSKSEELLKRLSDNIPAEVVAKNAAVAQVQVKNGDSDLTDDYDYSRDTYKRLVDKGQEAIDHMMELALQSDHPRAYEVLGGMLKNVSDMTDKLVSLHGNVEKVKAAKTAKGGSESSSQPSVTNNNVFVGSTTDLQRFIIAQQQQNVIEAKPAEE